MLVLQNTTKPSSITSLATETGISHDFCTHVFRLQVKAVFPGDGLEMVAQVYSSSKLGCLVVELTRRAGDAFKFSELRENLAKQLGPIISGAADVKAIASKCVPTQELHPSTPPPELLPLFSG